MGVKDLARWIKRNHPHVLVSFPLRWHQPAIRNKRIAVDATLLTNRFHFADPDQNNRSKSTLAGWYSLIRQMQRAGVQPVAVWDERGDRPWKAPEARKRLEARARIHARKLHEDRRGKRLQGLEKELELFRVLSELEQTAVLEAWAKYQFSVAQFATQVEEAASSSFTAALPSVGDPFESSNLLKILVIARTAAHLLRLSTLYEEYGDTSVENPAAHSQRLKSTTYPFMEALEREEAESWRIACGEEDSDVTNSEDSRSSTGRASGRSDKELVDAALNDLANSTALDARLSTLVPSPPISYFETARQQDLTDTEREVFDVAFGRPDLSRTTPIATASRTPDPLDAALTSLAALIMLAETVQESYARMLDLPLASDHSNCRDLLQRMGVPVLIARIPYEAEGLSAALALSGQVDFVATEDSDVIVYGAPLIRNATSSNMPLQLVDPTALRQALPEFKTDAEFRDFCILLGTDASPRIPSVGPAKAHTLIKQHGSIEAILAAHPALAEKIDDVPEFLRLVANARDVFGTPPPLPDAALGGVVDLAKRDYDARDVRNWLREAHGVVVGEKEPRQNIWVESDRLPERADGGVHWTGTEDWGRNEVETRDGGVWEEHWDERWAVPSHAQDSVQGHF